MKTIKISIFVLACAIMTSCSVTKPYAITENPIGSKTGMSESTFLFGTIHFNGNHGVAEAAKNGGITGGISTVDLKTTYFFGPLIGKRTLIVTGE